MYCATSVYSDQDVIAYEIGGNAGLIKGDYKITLNRGVIPVPKGYPQLKQIARNGIKTGLSRALGSSTGLALGLLFTAIVILLVRQKFNR